MTVVAAPKLVEELKLLREAWGEGFDEDIAQPIAKILRLVRESYEAAERERDERVQEAEDERHEAEQRLHDMEDFEAPFRQLMGDLLDIDLGLKTYDEVLRHWKDWTRATE